METLFQENVSSIISGGVCCSVVGKLYKSTEYSQVNVAIKSKFRHFMKNDHYIHGYSYTSVIVCYTLHVQ